MHGAHEHPAHEQDTLRASFGVRLLAPFSRPLSRLSSDRTFRGQSLAENAQSDAVQLTRLPGFGSKKVTRIDHVFEQPFHMGTAGDGLPATTVSSASASAPVTATTSVPAVAARPRSSRGDGGKWKNGRGRDLGH